MDTHNKLFVKIVGKSDKRRKCPDFFIVENRNIKHEYYFVDCIKDYELYSCLMYHEYDLVKGYFTELIGFSKFLGIGTPKNISLQSLTNDQLNLYKDYMN